MYKKIKKLLYSCLVFSLLIFCAVPPDYAFADTDGTEPQITQQPDKLILQLGSAWTGVEFTLKTDAGVFPATIKVDDSGILQMDLGGSSTYTLSCLDSIVPIPLPDEVLNKPVPETKEAPEELTVEESEPDSKTPVYVFILLGIAAAGAGTIITVFVMKRRWMYDEDYDYEDEEV